MHSTHLVVIQWTVTLKSSLNTSHVWGRLLLQRGNPRVWLGKVSGSRLPATCCTCSSSVPGLWLKKERDQTLVSSVFFAFFSESSTVMPLVTGSYPGATRCPGGHPDLGQRNESDSHSSPLPDRNFLTWLRNFWYHLTLKFLSLLKLNWCSCPYFWDGPFNYLLETWLPFLSCFHSEQIYNYI